mgnify:CR=1 FL=1
MTLVNLQRRPALNLSHLFNDFFSEAPLVRNTEERNLFMNPAVNIYESPQVFHLELAVPGCKKEKFQLECIEGNLQVSYQENTEGKEDSLRILQREYRPKSFRKSFFLDEKIDTSQIEAQYEDGLLKIRLPKKEKAAVDQKVIPVK